MIPWNYRTGKVSVCWSTCTVTRTELRSILSWKEVWNRPHTDSDAKL